MVLNQLVMRAARIRDPLNGVRLKLKDAESAFVFGGDLFDRGPGDLRLARELIDLKKKLGSDGITKLNCSFFVQSKIGTNLY